MSQKGRFFLGHFVPLGTDLILRTMLFDIQIRSIGDIFSRRKNAEDKRGNKRKKI